MSEKLQKKQNRTTLLVAGASLLGLCLLIGGILLFRGRSKGEALPLAVKAGDTVVLQIQADEVEDLYGYQFELLFDDSLLAVDSLSSSISEVSSIFKKAGDGYIRVGATKVGDKDGTGGTGVPICEIVLTAADDGVIEDIQLLGVNVVTSGLDYLQNREGWNVAVTRG